MEDIRFIDLFAGIGGFRLGLESEGFKCVFSCEIDKEASRTYNANFSDDPSGDVTTIDPRNLPNFEILCAGFPCQPFSISGKKQGFLDARGTLFFDICRIIDYKKPAVVFLENVKHLVHHDEGKTLSVILSSLESLGYTVTWRVLNALDYGVPQNRERIVIIGTKGEFDFNKVATSQRVTLEDYLDIEGNFEYLEPGSYTILENPKTQKLSGLRFVGYRNKALRKAGVRPGTEHLSRVHKQPNRIYSVEGTHPTLPSQEYSGRFWIQTKNGSVRKLTLNECFRIMGFPDDFKRPSSSAEQYKQIGNSVCVPMIKAIAKSIKEQIFQNKK